MTFVSGTLEESAGLVCRTTIVVRDLAIDARIGVHDYERGVTQPLKLTIEIEIVPPVEDSLRSTMDYVELAGIAMALAQDHTDLIETYACNVATAILRSANVIRVNVTVEKPKALPGMTVSATCSIHSPNGTVRP